MNEGNMDDLRKLIEIKQYKNGAFNLITDIIVQEKSFTIYINNERLLALATLPEKLEELALGFLYTEGIVHSKEEITSIDYNKMYINFQLNTSKERIQQFIENREKTSGCGSSLSSNILEHKKEFSKISINQKNIVNLMKKFHQSCSLFRETGGVHSASLVKDGNIVFFANDIGRHNAVDKVVGMAILSKIDLQQCYLFCSGRISSEIVKKTIRIKIPLIVSHSAPTSEAIRLGWEYKVFIIGFARGERFNIYTGIDQIADI